ncbi:putative 1-phosphatidylinositol 3-phosphate 5-kinase isoform X2 [Ochlerotatus camptorhynchus]|uniref:putative 1-phosphatidylinositol 3-phosphate 5-kinase isoform X2 n=1 Tax=Ochlerotatus camptorhynchus TaxID=644619 RepID=UPI0031D443D6
MVIRKSIKMNKNLHSSTALTEFARNFDEEPKTLFTKIVDKITTGIYNTGSSAVLAKTENFDGETSDVIVKVEIHDPEAENRQSSDDVSNLITNNMSISSEECPLDINISQGRTSINVLKRLINLVSQKPTNYKNYKHTELQKLWMPDSTSIECYDCSAKFSTFRRKHHCRLCGQIFCTKCCNQVVPGKIINCSGDLKVCTYCSKVVLTYLKSPNIAADLKSDLRALQEDLSNKLSTGAPSAHSDGDSCVTNIQRRKISVGYQEERFVSTQTPTMSSADRKTILQQSNSLRALYEEMIKVLSNQNRGLDLIGFLISTQKSSNNRQAIAILNAMTEAGFLIPLSVNITQSNSTDSETDEISVLAEFDESMIYKFLWMDDDVSQTGSYELDVDFKSSSVHLMRQSSDQDELTQEIIPPSAPDDIKLYYNYREAEMENSLMASSGAKALLESFCAHEDLLLNQLLRSENMDPKWAKTLIPIAARVANTVRPQVCGLVDAMDIRNYVFFKKVPGGKRHETQILGGVAFSKNVVHRQMMSRIEKPKILLLQCAIAYQRVEGKFVSFDTLMLQERDYLRNKVTKILSLGPNIVLVHKNVAGIAQDMLRNNGITLVLDVKLCVMDRIARCLDCDILTSVDSNVGQPKLGTCDTFHIQTFYDEQGSSKTLMCFERSYSPRGCCVLLRGGSKSELVKIKKVLSMLLFARYNWRLELAYLCDEYARPPSPRSSIFESKETSPSEEFKTCSENQSKNTSVVKKVDEGIKKANINIENVRDFSDPLRAVDISPSDFESESSFELAVETPFDNRFRTALSSTILSVSPFFNFPLPYLETENGRKCPLRCYFPNELYYSKQWSDRIYDRQFSIDANPSEPIDAVELSPPHDFTMYRIISPLDTKEVQTMLANFRASGGRYPKQSTMQKVTSRRRRMTTLPQKSIEEYVNKDALCLENHQRLPVLFCSFYYNPNAPSSFCAQPSFLNMQFYGQNDIMLGEFLERYCFRSSYICKSCNLPMLDHVRRYVHSHGSVHVKLSEDFNKVDTGTILITSKCTICNAGTKPAPMSNDTWCYSFAKYLEQRFHGHSYKQREIDDQSKCDHALHRDHVQKFSYMGIVASFMYSPIDVWEISLPSMIVKLKGLKACNPQQVVEEVKNFAMKGYEVYAKIFDKLAELSADTDTFSRLKKMANQDQMNFKQRVEAVQTRLTEKIVSTEAVEDAMLLFKKTLAETIDEWEPRLHDITVQSKSNPSKSGAVSIDSGTIVTEDLDLAKEDDNNQQAPGKCAVVPANASDTTIEASSQESITECTKTDEKFIKDGDRKRVKGLLSQFLSPAENTLILNSPLPSNEHHSLRSGLFPVMVNDHDLSSCIAHSLVSSDYMKALDNIYSGNVAGHSPHLKRKSLEVNSNLESDDSVQSKTDNAESRKSKNTSHVDVHFQIYFLKNRTQLVTLHARFTMRKSLTICDVICLRRLMLRRTARIQN